MKLLLTLLLTSGALVACASANDGDNTNGTGTIAPGSGGVPSRPPSSSSSSSTGGIAEADEPSEPVECPQDVPLTVADLDKEVGWKPGAQAQGSCTTTEITQIEANFKDTGVRTYFDLAKNVSDTCRACAFSKDSDATWAPIVGTAENNGETGFINYGACFGAIEGGTCGKAIQYQMFCENVACGECTTTTSERAKCIAQSETAGGMCESFVSTKTTSCPSWTLNVKSCGEIQTAIKTLCGAPS